MFSFIKTSRCFVSNKHTSLLARKSSSYSILNSLPSATHVFRGKAAETHLTAVGLPKDTLSNGEWTTNGNAPKVADAVLNWATGKGATSACHWFQPMTSTGTRHGLTGQLQVKLVDFDGEGELKWDFKAKNLLQGETDGSSYPNGGLRCTHKAGAYTTIDPSSPIFVRGDTMFIPSCLVSYEGKSLDEKTPLLRSCANLSKEGSRLLKLLGVDAANSLSVTQNIGLEQELFFVDREAYLNRLDLQLTGRTVFGRLGPRGQEMSCHYMAPIATTSPVLACMQEIQDECFTLGIPLRTRHREVAPNQYEFAPTFGPVVAQIDQNLMVMQIIEEVSKKHNLAGLMHEKPFDGVNGSGKHNNWSLCTNSGVNLFNPEDIEKAGLPSHIFPVVMTAMVKAISEHSDLLRMSIACPGNDFRLGACEAPPAIITTYLGDSLTNFLHKYHSDGVSHEVYRPQNKIINVGGGVAPITVPIEDRNRTSPFAFGGHRFEFRAVGSSQNVSMVNTVLATIIANEFKNISVRLEAGEDIRTISTEAWKAHNKVVFNGDGYCDENQDMLVREKGLLQIDSGIESIGMMTDKKNVELFIDMNVFIDSEELIARQTVRLEQYIELVKMEASCLLDAFLKFDSISVDDDLEVNKLKMEIEALTNHVGVESTGTDPVHPYNESLLNVARRARILRLDKMVEWRKIIESMDAKLGTNSPINTSIPSLLFIDVMK